MTELNSVLIAVTNYDFSAAATALKTSLEPFAPTVLIDASSPTAPVGIDISIPNTMYGGLWDAAVAQAISRGFDWLFFIASDVQVHDPAMLMACVKEAIRDERIGVYTPSLNKTSRCAYRSCFRALTATVRQCSVVEGFCFLARTKLLAPLHPIGERNRHGWFIDKLTSYVARGAGLLNVVDDRVSIHHPQSLSHHAVAPSVADSEGTRFLAAHGVTQQMLQETLAIDADLTSNLRIVLPLATRSLDLGCGEQPRNPFQARHLHGLDVRDVKPSVVAEMGFVDLATDAIPYSDNSFDYITAYDVLSHIPRIIYRPGRRYAFIELMNEIHRCLRPGGLFLSLTAAYPNKQAFEDPAHVNFITEDTFPAYFSGPDKATASAGFVGAFDVEHQSWQEDGRLLSVLRAVVPS